jgi:hypothetical protein
MLRFLTLVVDFDGTLAHDGVVAAVIVDALVRVRTNGRRLIVVTGRQLDDLMWRFPHLDLFDRVVAEARSPGLGHGATFTVTLPIARGRVDSAHPK